VSHGDDARASIPVREEIAMNVPIPNLSTLQRETLEKYLPVLLAIAVAWLLARGLKKMFWTAFGLFWAFRATGMSHLWRW
jgi:hypothetical protein